MSNKEISQLDLLTILYNFPKTYHAYLCKIEPSFFEDMYRSFFHIFQNHYKRFSESPSESVFSVEVEEEEKKNVLSVLNNIKNNYESIKLYSYDYVVSKLDAFMKKCVIKKFLINSYDSYERNDFDNIIKNINRINEAIVDNDLGEEYHDKDFYEARYNHEKVGNIINSGIIQFDDMFGGWHTKTLNVIAGPSNAGKTFWLINFVSRLLLNTGGVPNKILYVTLEIDKEQVGRRIDSCISGTPMKDLWTMRDINVRELIAQSKDMGNRVIIKEMPAYKTTPSDIEAMIRNLDICSDGDLKPNIVIIDYLGLMIPTFFNKNMGLYEKGLGIAVELRGIAQMYNVPLIVAAQTNRSSFEDRIGQDKIADSIGIVQTADMLLTINRTDEGDRENLVNIYLAKSRFSKRGETFIFNTDYDSMRADEIVGGTANGDTKE